MIVIFILAGLCAAWVLEFILFGAFVIYSICRDEVHERIWLDDEYRELCEHEHV